MNDSIIAPENIGHYVITTTMGEAVHAYIPKHLPPHKMPTMEIGSLAFQLYSDAINKIGLVEGLSKIIPNPTLFLSSYINREAVLSSQIEGTQSSLDDMMLGEEETQGDILLDIRDTANYLTALDYGMAWLRADKPLCLRLMRDLHKRLLSSGRGDRKMPGDFRKSQNWIGGTRPGTAVFVPPPPEALIPCLDNLEKFLNPEPGTPNDRIPPLLRAGFAHLQFETIHPFLDGNGRVGRMLISLILVEAGLLSDPILYLSLFFKENRDDYYRLLNEVRQTGSWDGWISFFLTGIRDTADDAAKKANQLLLTVEADKEKIAQSNYQGIAVDKVFQAFIETPVMKITTAANNAEITFPTATKAIEELIKLGIVFERTHRQRDRIYEYGAVYSLLAEGLEPLPR